MLSPVLMEKFNIFKPAQICLKLIRKAFELYKDSEMTHWLRTRFPQTEEIQLYRPDSLFASFFQRLRTLQQCDSYIEDRSSNLIFSFPKERYLFFFSKASLSTTTWPSHWSLVFDLFFLLHCTTASELSEELLSFNYLIFPVVLLGKPQDVVAHLTDLSKWLMSLVSQILHLHYRILTIEGRLQNLEHLQTQKRIRLD